MKFFEVNAKLLKDSGVSINDLRNAADVLTLARNARLTGQIQRASKLEAKAENILKAFPHDLRDDLLTVWECSLADSPAFVEEWQCAYSLDELLEMSVINDEEYKQRLDSMHGRGQVRQ